MRRAGPAVALGLGAALALASAPGALAASRTLTLEGWHDHVAALAGRALVVTEAATARVDPRVVPEAPPGATRFDYYRAEVSRLPLDRAGRRFAGRPDTPVAVRTSIARMGSGILSAAGANRFVAVPATRGGAPPVIWCCDAAGTETVVESDGRPDAPVAMAASEDAGRVRFLLARPDGRATLVGVDPVGLGERRTEADVAVRTAPGLVALAPGVLAWIDPSAPGALQAAVPADDGLRPAAGAPAPLPGAAFRVWAAPGMAVVAVRRGTRVLLVRWDVGGAARAVWSGPRLPRVAVGGGSVAVGDGRRVLAARRGGLRLVRRTRGRVAAVAVDGRRLAWLERGRRRGARVSVAHLGAVP